MSSPSGGRHTVRMDQLCVGLHIKLDSWLGHPFLFSNFKKDAAVVNLRRDLDDSIERTLRPAALPPAIHDYLSPRKRICYFVDHADQA